MVTVLLMKPLMRFQWAVDGWTEGPVSGPVIALWESSCSCKNYIYVYQAVVSLAFFKDSAKEIGTNLLQVSSNKVPKIIQNWFSAKMSVTAEVNEWFIGHCQVALS